MMIKILMIVVVVMMMLMLMVMRMVVRMVVRMARMGHPLKKSKCCLLLFGRSHLIRLF